MSEYRELLNIQVEFSKRLELLYNKRDQLNELIGIFEERKRELSLEIGGAAVKLMSDEG